MTDDSAMPSSRAQRGSCCIPHFCQGLLPTLQNPGHQGSSKLVPVCHSLQLRSCQAGGKGWWHLCAPGGSVVGNGCVPGKEAAQMAPDGRSCSPIAPGGIARAFLEISSVKSRCAARDVVLCCATTWQHLYC